MKKRSSKLEVRSSEKDGKTEAGSWNKEKDKNKANDKAGKIIHPVAKL